MEEREAVARLKAGDIGGLETLVQMYQVQALRTAYLVTRGRHLAEDIVQTAFLRAYERIGQFDAQRSFGPWFLRSVVNAALGRLPPEQRTAIVLRYYLGLSEADMAGALACPPGTVKRRLHRARARLRKLLDPIFRAWVRPAVEGRPAVAGMPNPSGSPTEANHANDT